MTKKILSPAWLLAGLLSTASVTSARAQSQGEDAVYAEVSPRNWVAPVYPPAAIKDKVEGSVIVELIVDENGQTRDVTLRERKPTAPAIDARLETAVVEAAKGWTFAPALNAGKPEPRALAVEVRFFLKGRGGKPSVVLPLAPETLPVKPARVIVQPDPAYPEELLTRKLPGTAEFEFKVTPAGEVADIVVRFASDAAFVPAGLATLHRWRFEPATQGALKVASPKISPMEFSVEGMNTTTEDILEANGISGLAQNTFETPPVPQSAPAPIFPRERLIADESGTAEVEFTVNEKGLTENVAILSADHAEFGAALAAAVELWVFKPAVHERARTKANLRAKHTFALKDGTADARLAGLLKGAGVANAKGLDQRLTPLWRIPPAYPAALLAEKTSGTATIELIIDREGRVRLPRVVSATHAAFGWAAATAVSQWVFVAPTKQGEPADVRVSIPIEFTPPES